MCRLRPERIPRQLRDRLEAAAVVGVALVIAAVVWWRLLDALGW
jgi:hypothetical protein